MNLDEAIKHYIEIAASNEECREENMQLAEWLTELKVRRTIQMSPMYSIPPAMENAISHVYSTI